MKTLVEFVAVAEEKVVENFDSYMMEFQNYLVESGIIDAEEVDRQFYSLTEVPLYLIDFHSGEYIWRIGVEYSTYEKNYELMVSIQSENYIISTENEYLERLKRIVKNFIKIKHKKIFWLYDSESEFLATDLYPKVFTVENLARKFITLVMNRKFGIHWWKLVSLKIQEKHKSRFGGYKAIIDNFKDVDERLMSIDTGDLHDILSNKVMKWESSEENIMELTQPNLHSENLAKILQRQQVVYSDWWQTIFSPLLPESFLSEFKDFELNRNHIAHNKLIDKAAYKSILHSIDVVQKALDCGLEKMSLELKSKEVLKEEEFELLQEVLMSERNLELKEIESGVIIRNSNQILALFNDELSRLYESIEESFRFSEYLNFSDYTELENCNSNSVVFEIQNKIDGYVISFEANTDINDSEGSQSFLYLEYKKDGSPSLEEIGSVSYNYGEVEFNEFQGNYMPIQMDGISEHEMSRLGEKIVDIINSEFTDYKEIAESSKYSIIKDGGPDPILDLPCQECGEEWICVDETITDFGRCLNCGEINEVT
ncbi:hypothetical protein TZ94_01740 [Streptococcus infantis]|uniref:Swt1-like HEPN domain-containing protein n=1 Tax=Streptococcus infantis TaxID=68892 RepID=A0A0F2DTF3_9STRE|nr:hypothetical protein [Streptococcus infantis]KJQ74218.1 hypothetical protein TZ94_01740 [Streptococcus infantis]